MSVDYNEKSSSKRKLFINCNIIMFLNIVLTIFIIIFEFLQKNNILGKIIITIGPILLMSFVVWLVLKKALATGKYDLIGGYNRKYNYNIEELENIIAFILQYVLVISLIAIFTIFILAFFSNYSNLYKYIFYVYLISFFSGIVYINFKKRKVLYDNK